jgi:hypothetical protein
MNEEQVTIELAEEIRTSTHLRHRLGMDEGSDSGKVDDENAIGITTKDHETFFITVFRA